MDWFEHRMWNAKSTLKAFAMKLYRNVDDADDAVQDTMLRAITHRDSFVRGTNMEGWLMTILKNRFRIAKKSGHAKRMTFTDDPRYADHILAADSPERAMIVAETFDAFGAVLVEAQRDTLMLLGLGFSYAQVAAHEDVAEGTVKSRAKRGRERLVEMVGAL
jgi:RNA polymerase sigma-70 factor (ECF subfamily)